MITLAGRNIKIFLRDKAGVFWSFLSVILVFGLYVLFLGNMIQQGFAEQTESVRFLIDSWIMAGMIAIASITTTMGAFGVMVEDKGNKTLKDFLASPVSRRSLVGGYLLGAYAVGVIMTLITFVFAQGFIVVSGGEFLPLADMLKAIGVILISAMAGSAIVFFIVTSISSINAFSAVSTILGTLIGFITGTYMNIGILPAAVQWAVRLFPISHAASLLRQIMMRVPTEITFAGAPEDAVTQFNENMGVVFYFGAYETPWFVSVLVLLVTTAVFYALAILNMKKRILE
jgi:multidrug/hemolysin transport system permease protein